MKHLLSFFKPKSGDDIYKILMPSVVGILLCVICLAGGTYAWFDGTTSTPAQNIATGNYEIAASIDQVVIDQKVAQSLEANKEYVITLKASGTATSGYCIIHYEIGDIKKDLHTQQIAAGSEITITLTPEVACKLQITAQWGTSSKAFVKEGEVDPRLFDGKSYLLTE